MLSSKDLDELIRFRRELHQHPELSGFEENTAHRIVRMILPSNPDKVYEGVGGHGILAIYKGRSPGKTLMVRTDMDALPIQEDGKWPYASTIPGVAHLCGHDGHTTIGVAVARMLGLKRPESGDTILLFQPSEENGMGARRMLEDPVMKSLHVDSVIALHNLPGLPANQVVVKDGPFACASEGLILQFNGHTSHAAEPENGINPIDAILELLQELAPYRKNVDNEPFTLITVVHINVGNPAFGISPGTGTVMLTLRAEKNEILQQLKEHVLGRAHEISKKNKLRIQSEECEHFAATINQQGFAKAVHEASQKAGLTAAIMKKPFRWSEDAGVFIEKYGGGLLGLGAGMDVPDLHHPLYDFPDKLIAKGAGLLCTYIYQWHHAENVLH
jgi:amidohydrolase